MPKNVSHKNEKKLLLFLSKNLRPGESLEKLRLNATQSEEKKGSVSKADKDKVKK